MKPNEISIRVYYEDTDCGNFVYYANYLKYMERGRTELLRQGGIDLSYFHSRSILFAVVETRVRYRLPAKYNDMLIVKTRITKFSAASITFETAILKEKNVLLVESETKLACINATTERACKIPAEISRLLR